MYVHYPPKELGKGMDGKEDGKGMDDCFRSLHSGSPSGFHVVTMERNGKGDIRELNAASAIAARGIRSEQHDKKKKIRKAV